MLSSFDMEIQCEEMYPTNLEGLASVHGMEPWQLAMMLWDSEESEDVMDRAEVVGLNEVGTYQMDEIIDEMLDDAETWDKYCNVVDDMLGQMASGKIESKCWM